MADNGDLVSGRPENTAGAASDALSQRPGSAASCKQGSRRRLTSTDMDSLDGDHDSASKENAALQREREERIRLLREKQNEERQRKLEELKQQALAAQKFREQKEEERRRRIEEMRQRDGDRRHQVEERKRQIMEAEQDRREAILRKNQEREARIESKRKNERSSIVFAFGSSTPRMLEPADTGGSYWATRRATSTTTLFSGAPLTLTRRGSERDLDGSKKRATSASGLDRKPGVPDEDNATSPDGVGSGYITPRSGAARRKTDLIPTLPSPRDGPPSSRQSRRSTGNTPNRAYSMSRLDQLSQPRKILTRPVSGTNQSAPERPPRTGGSGSKATLSSAKSMGHLAGRLTTASGSSGSGTLTRSDTSRSMTQLCASGPVPPPRMTRAERLRRRAREQAAKSQPIDTQSPGMRSGDTTPSRPQSAMSQQSMSSVNSSVGAPLRSRPVAAPRRPRPASIAVTGVTLDPPLRHSLSAEHKRQTAAANGAPGERPIAHRTGSSSRKTSSDRMSSSMFGAIPSSDGTTTPPKKPPKTVKASPRVTPKPTPLQSPRADSAPALPQDSVQKDLVPSHSASTEPSSASSLLRMGPITKNVPESGSVQESDTLSPLPATVPAPAAATSARTQVPAPSPVSVTAPIAGAHEQELTFHQQEQKHQEQIWEAQRQVQPAVAVVPPAQPGAPIASVTPSSAATSVQLQVTSEASSSEDVVDMTASMIAKRITTEEEAKAALAERRRLAREQAEREAELERQRLELERLAEEERLRQEEEDQRRFEEEQERLAKEARQAEEQRLLQAIEEAQKRDEEDRKRREEEARQKAEKEEADRKAKEEAEKQRREMELKLKREEEERMERRKRVEAIMLRTRGKGSTPTSTPTKENGDLNQSENEEQQQQQMPLDTAPAATTPVSPATTSSQSNGHSNGMDNVKQNNATNVLLDLSEHNSLSTVSSGHDLLGPLANEDCINSNLNANNGLSNSPPPYIAAFNDSALGKKQDSNVVTDLL